MVAILIGMLIPLFSPLLLAVLLYKGSYKTRLEWIFAAWFTLAFTLYVFLAGAWFLSSFYLRYASAGVVLAAAAISFAMIPRETPFGNLTQPRIKFKLGSYLVPSLLFTILSVLVIGGRVWSGRAVNLSFPLMAGTYSIVHGGSATLINAHHPYGGQAYALDIVRLNSFGTRAEDFFQNSLEQFSIFGVPVYSPCNGIVTSTVDGLEDLKPGAPADTQHPGGNHIFIDCRDEQVQVLLAHMQKNSLVVTPGAPVRAGDPIGRVGNSGNTTEPHLHIHVSTGGVPDRLTSGVGLPMLFNGRFLARNDLVAE